MRKDSRFFCVLLMYIGKKGKFCKMAVRGKASFETCLLLFTQLSFGFFLFWREKGWKHTTSELYSGGINNGKAFCRFLLLFVLASSSSVRERGQSKAMRACTYSLEYSLYLIESKINIFSPSFRSGFFFGFISLWITHTLNCHYKAMLAKLTEESFYRFFILISFPTYTHFSLSFSPSNLFSYYFFIKDNI